MGAVDVLGLPFFEYLGMFVVPVSLVACFRRYERESEKNCTLE